jgi:hypothetical protein
MKNLGLIALLVLAQVACFGGGSSGSNGTAPGQQAKAGKTKAKVGKAGGKRGKRPVIQADAVLGRRPGIPRLKEAMLAGYQARYAAELPKWPAATPREQTGEGFWGKLTPLFDTCAWETLQPVGLDCTEAPCVAILRDTGTDGPDRLDACDGFATAFPDGTEIVAMKAACGDSLVFVSPTWTLAPDDAAITSSRERREAAITKGWACASAPAVAPAPGPVVAPTTPPEAGPRDSR